MLEGVFGTGNRVITKSIERASMTSSNCDGDIFNILSQSDSEIIMSYCSYRGDVNLVLRIKSLKYTEDACLHLMYKNLLN